MYFKAMKLVIVAGGGGHFSPALAVINELPRDWEVLVIGRKYAFEGQSTLSFEYLTADKLQIPFLPITAGKISRSLTRHTITSLLKLPVGFFQALKILYVHKPDIVLSFGGYVSVPIVFAARLLHIPIIIHEQTLGAGLANKVAANFAEKICISWQESARFFPQAKVVLTGNPLRKEFLEQASETLKIKKTQPVIYITGGSAGSHVFNVLIEESLQKLLQKYIVLHQTGDAKEFNDFDRLEKLKKSLPPEMQKKYIVMKFVDATRVVDFLKEADLVVSRSGIATVTELLFLGKPCLLIPFPYGQRNEQKENALFVKNIGLAEVVDQHLLNADSFAAMIYAMMHNLHKYKQYAKEAKKVIDVGAGRKIVEVIADVYKQKSV